MSNYQNSLFSEKEITGQKNLFSDIENDDRPKTSEPVTCLGMTFANDDERRSYFRAELRKKLPELRNIDGFPIGSDDDIINLSDPPYYTACPNPWLNDFIAEWEQEKLQLEAEGKRSADFEVTEPYAADVSEGKNNPVYNAHSYYTKVPHPAIMRYILQYTQPGDIVFDGFCGTGMTGVAASQCGCPSNELKLSIENDFITNGLSSPIWGYRHSICNDLSPVATFLASNFTNKADSNYKQNSYKLLQSFKEELGDLYRVKYKRQYCEVIYILYSDFYYCEHCGFELCHLGDVFTLDDKQNNAPKCPNCNGLINTKKIERVYSTFFDEKRNISRSIKKSLPIYIGLRYNGSIIQIPIENLDEDYQTKLNNIVFNSVVPTDRMPKGSEGRRNDKTGILYIDDFYTKENAFATSKLYEIVKHYPIFKFAFLNTCWHATIMRRYNSGGGHRPKTGTLYVPSLSSIGNVYLIYQKKLSQLEAFEDYISLKEERSCVQVGSCTKLNLPSVSIDYIFTDPPFGANISYSELNSIWEGWLKVKTQSDFEAIENPSVNKGPDSYYFLMSESMKEYFRVLKPGKWMTVEFSNTSASVWIAIQNAIKTAGFVIANVSALDKKQGSISAYTTTTAVKQDLVITCYKPSDELTEKFKTSEDLAMNVWDFVEELLCHLPVHLQKGNKTTAVVERSPKILFDRVISYYVQHGYPVPMNAADFQRGLRERFVERDGMFFTAEQSIEYDTKRAQTESYEAAQSMFVGSEAEGIEWLKRELVEPKTYQDLQPEWMQALVQTKKGDNLPELKQILEENFLKDDEGRWYKPDPEKEADLEKVRARELARNFKAYVEMASTPKGKIKEARLEALRFGFRECYKEKDFATILKVAQRLPEALVMEDDVLLQFYDIAINRV